MKAYALSLLIACCTASCVADAGEHVSIRWLDYEDFVQDVQPILAAQCGNPSCHGRSERAFSIYSSRNWRVDSDHLYLPIELTSAELEHNFVSSCLQVSEVDDPNQTPLLLKPLGSVSGTYHGGGSVFLQTSDRSYRTLQNWIESGW